LAEASDGRGDLGQPLCVIVHGAAHKADPVVVREGDDPPAVIFLLAVERLGERRLDQLDRLRDGSVRHRGQCQSGVNAVRRFPPSLGCPATVTALPSAENRRQSRQFNRLNREMPSW
jgi:hypothetical protein